MKFHLGIFDLDIPLREDKLIINAKSSIAIKKTIYKHLLGGFPEEWIAKEFLSSIKQRYMIFDNVESVHLLKKVNWHKIWQY